MQQRYKTAKFIFGGYLLAPTVGLLILILPTYGIWHWLAPHLFWERVLSYILCIPVMLLSMIGAVFTWAAVASCFE